MSAVITATTPNATNQPQSITFFYNTVYRPEYLWAAIVSTMISGCSLKALPRGVGAIWRNDHTIPAILCYLIILG